MEIKQTKAGYIAATYIPTKKKWRTCLTKEFLPSESSDLDNIPFVKVYKNKESAERAVRKFKDRL